MSSGFGFVFALLSAWLLIYRDGFGSVAWPLFVLGVLLLFVGFWFYVRAKGYHPAWTLLFVAFGPTVFFVFFFLPDRHEQIRTQNG